MDARASGQVAVFKVAQHLFVLQRFFINDSQAALSHGLPLRDMLISMPLALSKSV